MSSLYIASDKQKSIPKIEREIIMTKYTKPFHLNVVPSVIAKGIQNLFYAVPNIINEINETKR